MDVHEKRIVRLEAQAKVFRIIIYTQIAASFITVDVIEKFKKHEIQIVQPAPAASPEVGAYGKYFDTYEFACDCIKGYPIDNPCDGYPETEFGKDPNLNPSLLEAANQFREYIGLPVVPTFGTRCPSSNDFWGGVPDLLHLFGGAFDCTVPGMDIVEAARIMYQVIGKPVRVYPDQDFMHVEESWLDGVYNQEQGYYIY